MPPGTLAFPHDQKDHAHRRDAGNPRSPNG